jgi:N-acetylmuramoyl-L-alanine amidase
MAIIKDCQSCPTKSVLGLDNQLIALFMEISPNLLSRIDDLNVTLGESVHPFLQTAARAALKNAIAKRGKKMIINSAWRTLAGQCLLYQHGQAKRCGIGLVGYPGNSNHQSAAAIDIEDYQGWKPFLEEFGWRWLGKNDPVHFDYVSAVDIRRASILAFQKLWNMGNPKSNPLAEDGIMGDKTMKALSNSPCDGFYLDRTGIPPRILKLTDPIQEGSDVEFVQAVVSAACSGCAPITGEYDWITESAVRKFQSFQNLKDDGIVSYKTWKIIRSYELNDAGTIVKRG